MADFRFLLPVAVLLGLLWFVPAASATHVQCGDAIAADTVLDRDLTCSGTGLTVTRSNVSLDLDGHTISGSGGFTTGVLIATVFADDDLLDVEITNGAIRGFGTGVRAEDATRPALRDMLLESNGVGFDCSNAWGCRIEDSVVRGNRIGAGMISFNPQSEPGVVTGSVFEGNGRALWFSSYPATVTSNRLVRNLDEGVVIDESIGRDVVLSRNVISNNGGDGIFVVFQGRANATHNRIVRNGGDGVRVERASADLQGNRIAGNAGDGIAIEGAGGVIDGNRTDRNGDDGIDIEPFDCCARVTVRASRAYFNADLGIEAAPGTADGGDNRAKHNGNPAQCVGVECK